MLLNCFAFAWVNCNDDGNTSLIFFQLQIDSSSSLKSALNLDAVACQSTDESTADMTKRQVWNTFNVGLHSDVYGPISITVSVLVCTS